MKMVKKHCIQKEWSTINTKMYKETNTRSIVKAISWRVLATITTIIIVYLLFGRLDLAISAGLIETVFKVGLYWAHERAWVKIRWGIKVI